MAKKPSIPRGTRDFGPLEMGRREYIFETIKEIFKLYGYLPIETPAMENLSTLLGKYGDEGDRLLYKILNSGDPFAKVEPEMLKRGSQLALEVCDRGLRYDLTVPFARYVVQHQNEIIFPFKRYQIQPVWRADRPQRGRYREFFQCDVDVIGSNSLINELELVQICDEVFKALNIEVVIKLNNRKVLAGIAEVIGHSDKMMDVTVAIDKIDKIGFEKVKEELMERGIEEEAISMLEPFLTLSGSNREKIDFLKERLSTSEEGVRGVDEMEELFELVELSSVTSEVEFDISLARGLNYYTGAIFEVKASEMEMGSICGGGRYDDLTGIFGLPDVSGVGISFGADRIYDVLDGLDRFPAEMSVTTQLLFANFGKSEERYVIPILEKLRSEGIVAELYPEQSRLRRQFDYAERRSIPYMAIIGANEMESDTIALKDLKSGEQISLETAQLATWLKERV